MPKGIHKKDNKALYEEIEQKKKNRRTVYPEHFAEPEPKNCQTCKRSEYLAKPGCKYYINCGPLKNLKGVIVKEGRGVRETWQSCPDHLSYKANMDAIEKQQWLSPTQVGESVVEKGLLL